MKAVVAISVVAIIVASAGCNRQTPLALPSVAAPSPLPAAPPDTSPLAAAVLGISFAPGAVFGSAPSTGTVVLTRPAPAGGVLVHLSSADTAVVTVPSSVTINEGANRASFPVATAPVAADRQVAVVATALETSVTTLFHVWAVLPNFYSWWSEEGDPVGQGAFGRLITPVTTFTATTSVVTGGATIPSTVALSLSGPERWTLVFGAPINVPLRLGRYEGTTRNGDYTRPRLDISGHGGSCNASTGRFEVRELVFVTVNNNPTVDHFDATFEQLCAGYGARLFGEVRYARGAR